MEVIAVDQDPLGKQGMGEGRGERREERGERGGRGERREGRGERGEENLMKSFAGARIVGGELNLTSSEVYNTTNVWGMSILFGGEVGVRWR